MWGPSFSLSDCPVPTNGGHFILIWFQPSFNYLAFIAISSQMCDSLIEWNVFWMVHLGLFTGIFVWLIKLLWSDLHLPPLLLLCSSWQPRRGLLSPFTSWSPRPPISAQFKFHLFHGAFPHYIRPEECFCPSQHLTAPLNEQHTLASSQMWPCVHIYIFTYITM